MNTSGTPETPAPVPWREPDRKCAENREVRFVWDLGPDLDGGTRQAVLSIGYHKGQRGGSFTATMLNQTENRSERDMGSPLDWTRIAAWQVARYGHRALEDFAGVALSGLRVRLELGEGEEEDIARYFQVQP